MNSKESLPLSTRTYTLTFNSEIMEAMTYMYVHIYAYALTNAKCRLYTVSGSVLEPISLKENKKTFAYKYVPGTFMHIMPRCIMSPDVDFLCKTTQLAVLNKGTESMRLKHTQMRIEELY